MAFYVYILADEKNSKFIVGFTRNLLKQIHDMKFMQEGIAAREQINRLIYYEKHQDFNEAKARERTIVSWDDDYMKQIISLQNGKFEDLYNRIFRSGKSFFG